MNTPTEPEGYEKFIALLVEGRKTNPAKVRDYVEQSVSLYNQASALLYRGLAKVSDSEAENFIQKAQSVYTLDLSLDKDGGLNQFGLPYKFVSSVDETICKTINFIGQQPISSDRFSTGPIDLEITDDQRTMTYDTRAYNLLKLNDIKDIEQRNFLRKDLTSFFEQEINGRAWLEHVLIQGVIGGIGQMDAQAETIWKTVSDELEDVFKTEDEYIKLNKEDSKPMRLDRVGAIFPRPLATPSSEKASLA